MKPITYSPSQGTYWYGDEEISEQQATALRQARDTGSGEAFLAKAGRTFSNAGQRIGLADAPQEVDNTAMWALDQEHPLASGLGAAAPMAAPFPGGAAAQILGGGFLGGLGAEPGQGGSGAAWGAGGGAAGHALGRVLSNVAGYAPQNLVPWAKKPAKEAARTGTPKVSLGEATGSETIKSIEHGIKSRVGGYGAFKPNQRQANVNDLALDVFGLKGKHPGVTDDARRAIKGQFKQEYNAIEQAIPTMDVPADLADDIRSFGGMPAATKRIMEKQGVVDFTKKGKPMRDMNGKTLMHARSRMLDKISGTNKDSTDISSSIDLIDDLIEAQTPGLKTQWAATREKYRFWKAAKGSLNEDNVSAAKLSKRMEDFEPKNTKIADARANVKALRSDDFKLPHGNPGTAQALQAGLKGSLLAPANRAAGSLLTSVADAGNPLTIGTSALTRAGILDPDAQEAVENRARSLLDLEDYAPW